MVTSTCCLSEIGSVSSGPQHPVLVDSFERLLHASSLNGFGATPSVHKCVDNCGAGRRPEGCPIAGIALGTGAATGNENVCARRGILQR